MSDEALYELRNLRKSYADRIVLDIEQLTIERGEILAVLGPSGAGKSTLLRLLNFLESPSQGSIRFAGFVTPPAPPLHIRRRVTMVFQRPLLLDRSVHDVVSYGLVLRGQHDEQRVQAALEQVGLAHMAHANARTLSGGEIQRAALARALVLQPDALLLDEPTANLDPANVALIEGLIRESNQQHSTTVVLVTHNVFQARRLAHRTALLLDGRLVEVGPTERVFSAPADPRTAAFVRGEMIY
ncbi:MAG: ABC transporter ATP-binding protein [Herpetosiphonaceae bacterium]|nr:MAG: ABC transporter ATP-binding protein [Herpetosiphonaceae bacterium]